MSMPACIVRPPLEFKPLPGQEGAELSGLASFGKGDKRADLDGGDIAISYLSFTTTNRTDFTTAQRFVELAIVDGSGFLQYPADPNMVPLDQVAAQTIILSETVATFFLPFPTPWLVPKDVAGPLLQRFRWKVGAAAGGFDWTIRVGLAQYMGAKR